MKPDDSEQYTALTILRLLALIIVAYVLIAVYVSLAKNEVHEGLQRLSDNAFGAAAALLAPYAIKKRKVETDEH